MKTKYIVIFICIIVLLVIASMFIQTNHPTRLSTTTTSVRFVNSTITADGSVTAQNQATLNFQTSGKLIYLPFKEGDAISAGQTVASLDTYAIQEQLKAALNNYRVTRNNFDQNKDNIADNVSVAQQVYPYNYYPVAGISGSTETTAINNAIVRIADNTQAGLDNSVINVELANYALQLSTLTSPLNGIVTHEGVTVSGVNITPATTFSVADPSTTVFRANVPINNINYVSLGTSAEIAIDGMQNKITGTVVNIYPSKVVLPNGESVYQVDIQSDQLLKLAKLDQTGTAMIKTNSENVALVPVWTVLGGKYIWVDDNDAPVMKTVTSGKIHGQDVEITSGLTSQDKIIIDPEYIQSLKYQTL